MTQVKCTRGPRAIVPFAMHELAICQALLRQLEELVTRHGASGVRSVTVQIGVLSGVEPSLLATAFCVARAGGCARRAELIVEALPARIRCRACGAEAPAAPERLCCSMCGAGDTQLLSGDELLLRQVELSVREAVPTCAIPAAAH